MTRVSCHDRSEASKLGGLPATYTDAGTCPDTCPFKASGCFARAGFHTRLHWDKVSSGLRGTDWVGFLRWVRGLPNGTLWRHNIAGDLPGKGNRIAPARLRELALSAAHTRGFTYTHKPPNAANLQAIRRATSCGFTINLSANNPTHADQLAETGLPVATVLPIDAPRFSRTPAGRRIVTCPAATVPGMTCARCGLCARPDRKVIVGFPAHGTQKSTVDAIARKG